MSALELAQRDPVDNLTANWTEDVQFAKRLLRDLEGALRQMDRNAGTLKDEHGITLNADLGPIGNAAAAARRDLEKQKPGPTFRMPAGA